MLCPTCQGRGIVPGQSTWLDCGTCGGKGNLPDDLGVTLADILQGVDSKPFPLKSLHVPMQIRSYHTAISRLPISSALLITSFRSDRHTFPKGLRSVLSVLEVHRIKGVLRRGSHPEAAKF